MARKARATVAEAAALAREALFASAARTDGGKDDRLGDVILYDLTPGWRAPIASVQDTFRANGLDPKHVLPNAPDWVVAFGRAVDQVGAKVRGEDVKFMDAAPGPNGERRVGIVQVRRNGVVATDDFGTVVCPAAGTEAQRAKGTHGGAPYIERDDGRGFAQAILDSAREYHEVYTLDDLRRAVVEHIDRWYGLPLRRTQPYVAYWVPAAGGDEIRRLRAAVEACQAGQIELFTGYRSDPESNRTVVNSVNKGLEAQLAEFRADVEKYTSKGTTKSATIEDMIENSKTLRERAGLYKAILGAAVEDVDAKYAEFEKTLRAHLGIMDASAEAVS